MITLQAALLCDAASVREGLLHVLGAGITLLGRDNYPAPLGADLALAFIAKAVPDSGEDHDITLSARNVLDPEVRIFDAKVHVRVDKIAGGESSLQSMALPLSLRNAGIPTAGTYVIRIDLDGQFLCDVEFEATLVDAATESPFNNPFG